MRLPQPGGKGWFSGDEGRMRLVGVGVVTALAAAFIAVFAMFGEEWTLDKGDCLTDLPGGSVGGPDVVACDDPRAKYKVATEPSEGDSGGGAEDVCGDHPDGKVVAESSKYGVSSEYCVVRL